MILGRLLPQKVFFFKFIFLLKHVQFYPIDAIFREDSLAHVTVSKISKLVHFISM
jgi:hypothetical protein